MHCLKRCFDVEKYVNINLASLERPVLAQIRFAILPLHIETGRFNNTKLEDRKCYFCDPDKVEDERHFLCECVAHTTQRDVWSDFLMNKCPDFHYLLNNNELKCIFTICPRATAKFIISVFIYKNKNFYR